MSAPFLVPLDIPVPDSIPDRMIIMAEPEAGQTDSRYFNGYIGSWCHRFSDWLAMHAGMPRDMIPNISNCGSGVIWFVSDPHSGGFFFKNAAHKKRMRKKYGAISRLPEDLTTEEIMYVPQIGDYIYFRWKTAKVSVTVSMWVSFYRYVMGRSEQSRGIRERRLPRETKLWKICELQDLGIQNTMS